MKILMVLTSHDELGNTGRKTGFWLEELAAPYYVFKDAGVQIVLASPKGGKPPLDPKSNEPDFQTDLTRRFEADPAALADLGNTAKLKDVAHGAFDAVFYPGGHGPMWDLAEDSDSIGLIERTIAAGKPVDRAVVAAIRSLSVYPSFCARIGAVGCRLTTRQPASCRGIPRRCIGTHSSILFLRPPDRQQSTGNPETVPRPARSLAMRR
ncbi:hypothetical protein B0G57_12776 [Trinickia symbiotica]|uniref:type 1 glutamine amidotransferase domain-containing protein n=1 Tax=Trinickia symbiotica TaxID=863227 RepID=UPI0003804C9D|nr:type 1 glutamine amidotransferase domain-containing protein [Trinickia symbiotica]PPK41661.1 hypothetical protein B0G57_12776 [Trinickia symbiotica]